LRLMREFGFTVGATQGDGTAKREARQLAPAQTSVSPTSIR
jgi:hypothetical protein